MEIKKIVAVFIKVNNSLQAESSLGQKFTFLLFTISYIPSKPAICPMAL